MDAQARHRAAKQFAENWAGRGYEKGDAQVFWTELLQQVAGMRAVSQNVMFEQHTASGGFIDCYIPDAGVVIEQKGLGVDLDRPEQRQGRMVTPFQQAFAYAKSFKRTQQPRFIVVCNFEAFRVHDWDAYDEAELAENYLEFTLAELGEQPHLLDFITDPANSRTERERQVSMQAGGLIGRLHDMLQAQYIDPASPASQHALNVLCVRLVFCLFCEDAELFGKDALLKYLRRFAPAGMRNALRDLFEALATPVAERDPYTRDDFADFPYVNGGLFEGAIEIPPFTPEIKDFIESEVSGKTDWSKISPTIFGGIFESTLNPETRRAGGMHYTSPENIHKVIDPLFLDGLHAELDQILNAEGATPRARKKALCGFHERICGLKFLDPACGSGNFLTETYLSLRRLEDRVVNALRGGQTGFDLGEDGEASGMRVSLSQFYGIEINDFAVRVAMTSLWIARLQANQASEMFQRDASDADFPLRDSARIVLGNALTMDWSDVIVPADCDFIMGNPPFIGYSNQSPKQKKDMLAVWTDAAGKPIKQAGKIDYVSAWYRKAAEYMRGLNIHAAFVSTNSICQGDQVLPIWKTLKDSCDVHIDFAWKTFVWNSEATDQAHVHVVIVGFSACVPKGVRQLFFEDGRVQEVDNINGYLTAGPDVFVSPANNSIDGAPAMSTGNRPADGGHLIVEDADKEALLDADPGAAKYLRPFLGSREFINGKARWCLWLVDANPAEVAKCPEVMKRVRACKADREAAPDAGRRKLAATPMLFREQNEGLHDYLVVPKVSSERRRYVPVGYVSKETICSDLLFIVLEGGLYEFGIITSQMHNAWMRAVAGRLEMRYRYSQKLVYNTFPWPQAGQEQRAEVEACAQAVLDARAKYPESTLADMYDPDNDFLYPELTRAHRELDAAVEAAYGVDFHGDEEAIVAHLFKLYAEATKGE